MTTDFRALCAELTEQLDNALDFTISSYTRDHMKALTSRARAALAASEQGPTDEEIMELMPQQLREDLATVAQLLVAHGTGISVGPGLYRVTLNTGIVEHCRAVLARWGRPAVEPVPVAEGLPEPEDRDAEGRCWLWSPEDACWFWERIDSDFVKHYGAEFLCLPHWALPLPQEGE